MIDSIDNVVTNDIEVSIDPVDLEFNPSNDHIYVANRGFDTVSVIDASNSDTLIKVYVGNVVSNTVSILDSGNNTVASTVDVNSLPLALQYNPFNNAVYVAGTLTGAEGLVSVIE